MRRTTIQSALCAGILLWAGAARGAFEDVEVSPRNRAMGKAYVGMELDAWSPYHNPAAMAWAGHALVAASYVRPFGYDFSSQSVVSGVVGIGKWGGAGFGIRRFGTDFRGEDLNSETTFTLAHGFRLFEDAQSAVALGWALHLYSLDFGTSVTGIDPGSGTTVGLDLSAQAVVADRTRLGAYALNVNGAAIGDKDREELIRRVGVGVSYAPYRGVVTLLDISHEQGEEVQFRGGAEFEVVDFLLLRGGIHSFPSVVTVGAGFRWRGLSVDYGLSTGGGVLPETHQFGIQYLFPKGK